MNWSKKYLTLFFGNAVLAILLILFSNIFSVDGSLVNVFGTSLLFFIITVISLILALQIIRSKPNASLLSVIGLATLSRILFSLIWLMVFRQWSGEISNFNVLEFILIYIYYLIADVVLLDPIVRMGKK